MKFAILAALFATSAFAGFEGEYKLSKATGDKKCVEDVRVTTSVNEKDKVVSVTLSTLSGSYIENFQDDLDIEFVEDDTGTIGYNREGGQVTERRASDIDSSTGFALILFGLPVRWSSGSTMKLSRDGNTLTFKTHDTIYGFGDRSKCVYKRTK